MKKLALILLLASAAAFPFSACKPMTSTEPFHMKVMRCDAATIRSAIIAGCAARGWSPSDLRQGVVRARILLRTHDLTVDIRYTDRGYTIEYVDSHNLDYDPLTGKINRHYDNWIRNLDKSIRIELSRLAADTRVRYETDSSRAKASPHSAQ